MAWWVPGIALPSTHPGTHPVPHPGYTSDSTARPAGPVPVVSGRSNYAVGLKSVAQLSLSTRFSGFQGITEVYNLVTAGNPDDHSFIPGNE